MRFSIAIICSAALALAFPGAFREWGGVKLSGMVVPAIQLIMFGMGTTLSAADFVRVAKRPAAVAIGAGLQFFVMPLLGYLLALAAGFEGELAAGIVLVGSVAGGTASNVVAYLAKADVALSVTMTCTSTLLSPLATPLAMKLLAGRFIEIDTLEMTIGVLKVVVLPVLAGLAVHKIFEKQFLRRKAVLDKCLSAVSMGGICFTVAVLTAPSRGAFAEAGLRLAAVAVFHNLAGYAAGYLLARLAGRRAGLDRKDARTIAIEVGMQNSGMASALATGVLASPLAALPANIFSVWMNFSGGVLASFWGSHEPKERLPPIKSEETPPQTTTFSK